MKKTQMNSYADAPIGDNQVKRPEENNCSVVVSSEKWLVEEEVPREIADFD